LANTVTVIAGSSVLTIDLPNGTPKSAAEVLAEASLVLQPSQRVALNGAPVADVAAAQVSAGDRLVVAGNKSAGR
jgi:hypothetical protein